MNMTEGDIKKIITEFKISEKLVSFMSNSRVCISTYIRNYYLARLLVKVLKSQINIIT